jgi:hypothetical protein
MSLRPIFHCATVSYFPNPVLLSLFLSSLLLFSLYLSYRLNITSIY